MTNLEKDALALEIRDTLPSNDIKKFIDQCIKEGKATKSEIKECVLFKIAQRFKELS